MVLWDPIRPAGKRPPYMEVFLFLKITLEVVPIKDREVSSGPQKVSFLMV
jgi:hypothetical protein